MLTIKTPRNDGAHCCGVIHAIGLPAMSPRAIPLNKFLSTLNLPGELKLPWTHSTSASNLMDIVADRKLLATPCTVFKGENLCYLFVGLACTRFG
jgi:hypothetical protein